MFTARIRITIAAEAAVVINTSTRLAHASCIVSVRSLPRNASASPARADIGRVHCGHRPSERPTGITIYLENDGRLEHAQQMAGHESPRTTKLYDRTKDEITLSGVERIRL